MTLVVRAAGLFALMLALIGCRDTQRFTAPTATPTPREPVVGVAPIPPSPIPPPLTGTITTYKFSAPLAYVVHHWTETSSFLLSDGGIFWLQYDSNSRPYAGRYSSDGDRFTFTFSDWDVRGSAIGTLNGELLEIRYNSFMELSDFENAVYRRVE